MNKNKTDIREGKSVVPIAEKDCQKLCSKEKKKELDIERSKKFRRSISFDKAL